MESNIHLEHGHFEKLKNMFPDISLNYLRKICLDKDESAESLEELTMQLLNGNYEVRELMTYEKKMAEKEYKLLIPLFPDIDPDYLMEQIKNIIPKLNQFPNELQQFVLKLTENKNYPTKSEYLKKQELLEKEEKYIKNFDLQHFIAVLPNPEEHFENPQRNVSYKNKNDYFYAISFLQNQFSFLHIKDIIKIFDETDCNLTKTANILQNMKLNDTLNATCGDFIQTENIQLLQEVAYIKNKTKILDYINIEKDKQLRAKNLAIIAGLIYTCGCCYDENLTDYELVECPSGHTFCKNCVRKYCEVNFSNGVYDFPCLNDCGQMFSLRVLKMLLPPNLYEKLCQKKQLEEMKQVEIEELTFCPFCEYVTVLPKQDKILKCANKDCMQESCRLCKKKSHIPFRCNEIEDKIKTNRRIYVEEKMTESLVRKCPKCSKIFLKESGCNKMLCPCGQIMCYVCKQPITGYDHFKENGGTECPVQSDTMLLHTENVATGAEKAKNDLKTMKF